MRAMVLAAGLGTRLRPLTDTRPKALVEVSGRTLLELVLERLGRFGVTDVIINVHHFADMIVDYLEANQGFGMRIEVSREDTLLDTGGGLKKASWFFLDDGDRLDEPFILHNVDVLSTINLGRMARFHQNARALATLAVQDRDTSRSLLFDAEGRLCGHRTAGQTRQVVDTPDPRPLAFTGIHVISPRMLGLISEQGIFSIIDTYLRLAADGQKLIAFRADAYAWRDAGSLESLEQANL
jgi:mannose-1-phosphate guanylyltransferase